MAAIRNILLGRIVLCAGLAAVVGCQVDPPARTFDGYPHSQLIHLKVAVVITNELRQFKSEGNESYAIGKAIAQDAPVLGQNVFTDVVVVDSMQSLPKVDAVLTPTVEFINRTTGATSFGESVFDLKVEWRLVTPDGKLIWVATTTGHDSAKTGNARPAHLLQNAIEEMLLDTQSDMLSSDAIKQFASTDRECPPDRQMLKGEEHQCQLWRQRTEP